MARLHITVDELASELDYALALLQRGGEVVIERNGEVVARLDLPPGRTAHGKHGAGEAQPTRATEAPEPAFPSPDEAALSLFRARAAGGAPFDAWDELNREEEFLEMLAAEEFID